jgi:hypothetical protein
MSTYEGILDDDGGAEYRLYVDTDDGSYIDVPREHETARTPLDSRDDLQRWRIEISDEADPAIQCLSTDEWQQLFDGADGRFEALRRHLRLAGDEYTFPPMCRTEGISRRVCCP